MADEEPCQIQLNDGSICKETKDLSLVKEIRELRQQQLQNLNSVNQDDRCQQLKIQILETAVSELGDLNVTLADTVTQLEREAVKYVEVFEKFLLKTSGTAERYMSQLEDINLRPMETTSDIRKFRQEQLSEILSAEPAQISSLDSPILPLSDSLKIHSVRKTSLESSISSIITLPPDTIEKSPTASELRMGSSIKTPETLTEISPLFSKESLSGSFLSAKSSQNISDESPTLVKSSEDLSTRSLIGTNEKSSSRPFDVSHTENLQALPSLMTPSKSSRDSVTSSLKLTTGSPTRSVIKSSESFLLATESHGSFLTLDSLSENMGADSSTSSQKPVSVIPIKPPLPSLAESCSVQSIESPTESPDEATMLLNDLPEVFISPEESLDDSDTQVNHSTRYSEVEKIPTEKPVIVYKVKSKPCLHQLQISSVDPVKHIIDTVLRKDKSETKILKEIDTNLRIVNDFLSDVSDSTAEVSNGKMIDDFQRGLKHTTDDLKELEQKIVTYTNSLEDNSSSHTEWQQKIKGLIDELDLSLYKIYTLEKGADLRENIQKYKEIAEEIQLTIDTIKHEMIAISASLTSRETKIKQMENYIKRQEKLLEDQVAHMNDANTRYLRERNVADNKYRECQEKLQEAQKKLGVLQSELLMTHEDRSEMLQKLSFMFEPMTKSVISVEQSELEVIYERNDTQERNEIEPSEISQSAIKGTKKPESDVEYRLQFCEERMEKSANLVRRYQETLLALKEKYPYISDLIDPQLLFRYEKASQLEFAEIKRASLTSKLKAKREQVSAKNDLIALLGKTFKSSHSKLMYSDSSISLTPSECEEEISLEELLDKLSDNENEIEAYKHKLEAIEKEKSQFSSETLGIYNSILMSKLKLYNEQLNLQDDIIKILKCLQEVASKRYESEKILKRESSVHEIRSSTGLLLEIRKTQIDQRNEIIDILQNMNANLEKEIKKHMQQFLMENSYMEDSYRNDDKFEEISLKAQLKETKERLARCEEIVRNVQQERKLSLPESCEAKIAVLLSKFEASEKQIDTQNSTIKLLQESLNKVHQVLHDKSICICGDTKESYTQEHDRRYLELRESLNDALREIERHNVLIEGLERERTLPQSQSQDLQAILFTRQLKLYEDHMSAQEELIKHLEDQLKKLKEQYENVITRTDSKIRLSFIESLRRSEDEIKDLENKFAEKQIQLRESLPHFYKSRNQYSQTSASETELILKNKLEQCQAELEMKDRIIFSLQQAAQEDYNRNLELGATESESWKVREDKIHRLMEDKGDLISQTEHTEHAEVKNDALLAEEIENKLQKLKLNVNTKDNKDSRDSDLGVRSGDQYSNENSIFEIKTTYSKNSCLSSEVSDFSSFRRGDTRSGEIIFEFTKFSTEPQSDISIYSSVSEVEALRLQIQEQTHIIQDLQQQSKRRESHLLLIEQYQDRCVCLEMLEDEYKYLKKKYEKLLLETKMARSKWQENVQCVCVLEDKVKLLQDSNKKLRNDLCNLHRHKQILAKSKNILSNGMVDIQEVNMDLSAENTALKNDVMYLQEVNVALSDKNKFLINDLSHLAEDNKILSNTLSDKESEIQALVNNEIIIHKKLKEVTSIKNKTQLDLANMKKLNSIQEDIIRQNEKTIWDLQHQVDKLTSDRLETQQHYDEAKRLEIYHKDVLDKNSFLENEIKNITNRYENQILDNHNKILRLEQEAVSNQNALKDMTQQIEMQNRLLTEKDSEIHKIKVNLNDNISSMQSENQDLRHQIQTLHNKLSNKDSEYMRLSSRNTVLESKLRDAENKFFSLQKLILDKESEYSKHLEICCGKEVKFKDTRLQSEHLQGKDECYELSGVKSEIKELQKELLKKNATEVTLQTSLSRLESALTQERGKRVIINSENSHLKSELFHLKSTITKMEQSQPTVFTQEPEHDVPTEEFLSLRRKMTGLKEEVHRLTALYENSKLENCKLQCSLNQFQHKLVYSLNQTKKDKALIQQYHHENKVLRAFNGIIKIEKMQIEKEYNKLENNYNTLKNYCKEQDKETILLEEELQILREHNYKHCYSDGDASYSLSDARNKIKYLNEKVLHLQSIINNLINSNSKTVSSRNKISISRHTSSLSVQPYGRNKDSYYLWPSLQDSHQPIQFEDV